MEGQHPADPFPEWNRVALADEECTPAGSRTLVEGGGREQMGRHAVVDERQVDQILAVSNLHEPAGLGPLQDRRHEIRVARAEDEVRPQAYRSQRCAVGREHRPLRGRLRFRIERPILLWIGL